MKEEFDINTTEGARKYLESEGFDVDKMVKEGLEKIEQIKLRIRIEKLLPTDTETEKWFEENIGIVNDCSASSAIYKFRLWLKERIKTF